MTRASLLTLAALALVLLVTACAHAPTIDDLLARAEAEQLMLELDMERPAELPRREPLR